MAMSISPPSFLIRAGLPACIRSRIATALFSHRFRSDSSMARCASDPVCGGTIRAAGVPSAERNALSGNVAAGTAARAVTALLQGEAWLGFHVFLVPHCIMGPLRCFAVDFN